MTLHRFNGAAAFQPRKRDGNRGRVVGRGQRFNGAAAFQPRKLGIHARHVLNRGFNGAAAFQPRKPRSERATRECGRRFNGAAAFQPRKRHVQYTAIAKRGLQWGRGFSAAETFSSRSYWSLISASMGPRLFSRGNYSRDAALAGWNASMGPRLFSRGNYDIETQRLQRSLLQWGRGFSAAETRKLKGAK